MQPCKLRLCAGTCMRDGGMEEEKHVQRVTWGLAKIRRSRHVVLEFIDGCLNVFHCRSLSRSRDAACGVAAVRYAIGKLKLFVGISSASKPRRALRLSRSTSLGQRP